MSLQHKMHRIRIHESGAEEWQCTECDRRILFELTPFSRTIIAEGENDIPHHGGVLGSVLSVRVSTGSARKPDPEEPGSVH